MSLVLFSVSLDTILSFFNVADRVEVWYNNSKIGDWTDKKSASFSFFIHTLGVIRCPIYLLHLGVLAAISYRKWR